MPESNSETKPVDQTTGVNVAIGWAHDFERPARVYAHQNKLPIINEMPAWGGLCLYLDQSGWSLIESTQGKLDHKSAFRLSLAAKYTAQGRDPLINAMGKANTILDMTAGWGTDALHIASGGCSVVAIERDPVVYLMLDQAAMFAGEFAAPGSLRFLNMDSAATGFQQRLEAELQSGHEFELVYLDPMFSGKSLKRAKSKKPMSIMQQLVPPPEAGNESALFANAMQIAQKRVVVKRALKAPYIDGRVPQGSIKSKLLRFDLYKP